MPQFTSIAPTQHLKPVIKNFFIIEFRKDVLRSDYFLPDGLPSFFYIQNEDPAVFSFGRTVCSLCNNFYAGYSNIITQFSHKRLKIIGASVFPVYFRAIFGVSPLEALNRFIPMEEDKILTPLRYWSKTDNNASALDVLEKYISSKLTLPKTNIDFFSLYKRLIDPEGQRQRVDELALQIGYSSRYFHSSFKENLGMSPKRFIKLVRFNHAIKYLYDHKNVNLSFVAQEAGYHDQSHFIRDFKAIAGKTPKEILNHSSSLAKEFRLF